MNAVDELKEQLTAAQNNYESAMQMAEEFKGLAKDRLDALAAAQLQIKTLREALQTYIDEHEECQDADDWMAMMCSIEAHHVADEALSLPQDLSALHSYGKCIADEVERRTVERCAKECSALSDNEDNSTKYRAGASMCVEKIRALPLGQIDVEELGK